MFAVVFIPDFSLQAALRQEPELRSQSVALIDPALSKPLVVQLTAAARAKGVTEGLTASQSMARCAELLIKVRSLAQEQAATDVLLQTAYAFSPNIEATAPGVCTMELKGLGLKSEAVIQEWATQLIEALAALNVEARIGIAVTPALALRAAHSASESEGRVPRVPGSQSKRENGDSWNSSLRKVQIVHDSNSFVSALPIVALNSEPEIRDVLERWGIRSVGALMALNKTDLAERLGPAAIALLNQVSTNASRPLKIVVPKETFEEQIEFENEIETVEPLLFMLRRFVEQLARRIEVIHLVIAEIHLRLALSSGAVYEHCFKIPAPTCNVETLFRMLQTHLETVRTDSPIVALHLEARSCKPDTHQFGLFETTLKNPNHFAETLARLTALCGADRVGTPVLEATHHPDAFRMKSPEFDSEGQASSLHQTSSEFLNGDRLETCRTGLSLRRFRPTLAAIIEFRNERPALIRSSVLNGALIDVRGPFLSSGDWWDRNRWAREEWDVQASDGALYRICRSENGCFVEGVYD